jgi:hypothetical protein
LARAASPFTGAVTDPAASVRADVERLLSSPKVPPQISVSGHVYDLQTGLVTTITGPITAPAGTDPGDEPATAWVTTSVGFAGVLPDGSWITPPWTQ